MHCAKLPQSSVYDSEFIAKHPDIDKKRYNKKWFTAILASWELNCSFQQNASVVPVAHAILIVSKAYTSYRTKLC